MVSLPLSAESKEKETIEIERIARINGLDLDIRTMVRRKLLKILLNSDDLNPPHPPLRDEPDRRKWIRPPYILANHLTS